MWFGAARLDTISTVAIDTPEDIDLILSEDMHVGDEIV